MTRSPSQGPFPKSLARPSDIPATMRSDAAMTKVAAPTATIESTAIFVALRRTSRAARSARVWIIVRA